MSDIPRYQLQAYVFDGGAVTRFQPHGWSTAGHILIHAPRSVRHVVVKSHDKFQVWDTMLPAYINATADPPPVVADYDDLDQAIMATVLGAE